MSTKNKEPIKIMATPSFNPLICEFSINRDLYPEGSLYCSNRDMAQGSLFFERLFALDEIAEVKVAAHLVTISKKAEEPLWSEVGKKVGHIIRVTLEEDNELFSSEYIEKMKSKNMVQSAPSDHTTTESYKSLPPMDPPSQNKLYSEIEIILQEQINPSVASHGGKISLVGVRGSSAYLKMEGGCQGCGMASVTLKQGVEQALKQKLPHLEEVVDITDHQHGDNPYYR